MADPKTPPTDTTAADVVEDIALQRVTAMVAAMSVDPIRAANQMIEWQNAVRGTHALLHAIVKLQVGLDVPIIVPRAAHQSPDSEREELLVATDPLTGDASVVLRSINRAERRQAEKAKPKRRN